MYAGRQRQRPVATREAISPAQRANHKRGAGPRARGRAVKLKGSVGRVAGTVTVMMMGVDHKGQGGGSASGASLNSTGTMVKPPLGD